jgi:hypothetical protein
MVLAASIATLCECLGKLGVVFAVEFLGVLQFH